MNKNRKIKDYKKVEKLLEKDLNYAQIGRILGVSRERIRQIVKKLCTPSV